MQREIDDTLGRDRPPALSDRHLLPYTVAVINEIQRFGNIVPMNLPHATSTDVPFRGFFLPKVFHKVYEIKSDVGILI